MHQTITKLIPKRIGTHPKNTYLLLLMTNRSVICAKNINDDIDFVQCYMSKQKNVIPIDTIDSWLCVANSNCIESGMI